MSKMNDRKVLKKMGIVAQEVTKSRIFVLPGELKTMKELVGSKNDVEVSILSDMSDGRGTLYLCQWIE